MTESRRKDFYYREPVKGPGSPLETTVLDIERKILHRDVTGGLEHPMAQPDDLAGVGDDDVGVDDSGVILRVSTVNMKI